MKNSTQCFRPSDYIVCSDNDYYYYYTVCIFFFFLHFCRMRIKPRTETSRVTTIFPVALLMFSFAKVRKSCFNGSTTEHIEWCHCECDRIRALCVFYSAFTRIPAYSIKKTSVKYRVFKANSYILAVTLNAQACSLNNIHKYYKIIILYEI